MTRLTCMETACLTGGRWGEAESGLKTILLIRQLEFINLPQVKINIWVYLRHKNIYMIDIKFSG